ncbi:MAG: Wzz/FepE/Etk N-terminal domain-containing protein [Clostridia bacterium]|nr:Wzz/FepE/Etk N-terminal domain-containing protein [Clostridia bacterium]
MELREFFAIVRKRMWIITLLVIVAVITSFILSAFVVDKIYSSSTSLILVKESSEQTPIEYNDILLNQRLVKTYSEVIKSRSVLQKVTEQLHLPMTVEELSEKISVESVNDTEIIKITVEDKDPRLAASIANTSASIFMDEIVKLLKMENVQIIDHAQIPKEPVRPRVKLTVAVSFFIALMAGLGVVFLIEYMDNTIKTPDDVKNYLDLPVLGTIPEVVER